LIFFLIFFSFIDFRFFVFCYLLLLLLFSIWLFWHQLDSDDRFLTFFFSKFIPWLLFHLIPLSSFFLSFLINLCGYFISSSIESSHLSCMVYSGAVDQTSAYE